MISALDWLTPEMVHALGWTLVHFLWQGVVIAFLLHVVTAFSRSALVRYNASLAALLFMTVSPLVTFVALRRAPETTVPTSAIKEAWLALRALPNASLAVPASTVNSPISVDWLRWFVCAWFAGVLLFGMRALGGWVLLERLRREKAQPIAASLRRRCLALQQRIGLSRTVQYLESHLIDSPAVVGWFRPIVLLPLTALTGLSPEQLEAVIAHELAHIKRLDCFVNLFQVATETVLFYHPAVWWVSRCVRAERENCCDDIAVRICGNPGTYAKALTLMETWRATPAVVIAANSGSLKSRIARVLGLHTMTHSVPRGGLAGIAVLCAAGALLAGPTFNVMFSHPSDPDFLPSQASEQSAPETAPRAPSAIALAPTAMAPTAPAAAHRVVRSAPSAKAVAPAPPIPGNVETAPQFADEPQSAAPPVPPSAEPSQKDSYIDGIRSAGFTNISVDDLIALKIQGVTPEYIRQMRAAGLNPTVHELISMKAQGVDPEYLREIRSTGLNPSVHELAAMKAVGVTPEYVRKVRSTWNDVTLHDLIGMRAQGIDPADAAAYAQLGLKDVTLHSLMSLKAVGVTPDYIRAMRTAGFSNMSAHEYLSAKAVGVTPEYVRALQSAGLSNLSIHDYISAKAQGITPEFIQSVRSHGFSNLTLRQLLALKMANVF